MTKHSFLRLHTLQAGHGDSLIIEYGDDPKQPHLVIIDGGVASKTTPILKKLLNGWPDATIDLLVISHIDDDHIAGAIQLLKDRKLRARIKDIWFNGVNPKLGKLEKLGFSKGNKLETMLSDVSLKLPWNEMFDCADVVVDKSKMTEPINLPLKATITLLSPTTASLSALRVAWDSNISRLATEKGAETAKTESDIPSGLERLGTAGVPTINIANLLQTNCEEDKSINNGSSIAFIFRFDDSSLLLAADAHADVLLESASLLPGGVPQAVDVLKLPHHGSAANTTADLIKGFPAHTYIVSTNGRHGHPDDLAIARIVNDSPGSEVLFNYPNAAYMRWLDFSTNNSDKIKVRTTKNGTLVHDLKISQ